jgi:hypothetical protein
MIQIGFIIGSIDRYCTLLFLIHGSYMTAASDSRHITAMLVAKFALRGSAEGNGSTEGLF